MEARDVLVTGGTGRLGRRVVDRLSAEGIEAAVRGADTIIHAAQSPTRESRRTAVEGTELLLEIAAGAGVSHFVYISVVGLDRVPLSYYREKLDAERLVERSSVPWTILRSTQFHEFVLSMVKIVDRVPFVVPIPKGWLFQPIDASEAAGRLIELALGSPAGRVPDISGPEVRTLASLTRAYLAAKGSTKGVAKIPLPGKATRAFREGAQVVAAAPRGDVTWEEFLERRFPLSRAKLCRPDDRRGKSPKTESREEVAMIPGNLLPDNGQAPRPTQSGQAPEVIRLLESGQLSRREKAKKPRLSKNPVDDIPKRRSQQMSDSGTSKSYAKILCVRAVSECE